MTSKNGGESGKYKVIQVRRKQAWVGWGAGFDGVPSFFKVFPLHAAEQVDEN